MADMCYECQFSDNGYFCRFMEHGVCTAVSCKWMVEFEGRETCKLLNGGDSNENMDQGISWSGRAFRSSIGLVDVRCIQARK